jgi:putative heme-binding domain-containing protein
MSPERRKVAIDLLAHSDFATAGQALLKLVDPKEPALLQAAALRGLSRMRDDLIAATLLEADRFAAYTPSLRDEVLSAMFTGPQHIPGLLTAIETGVVPRVAVDSLRKKQLTGHKDAAIRERAAKLFSLEAAGNRAKVYEEMKSLVSLPSHAGNGRLVFKKVCAACHRLDREGHPLGPDLFGIRNQPKEAILLHILIPEQEITPGFFAYVLTTKDGRVLTGLVTSETATSVTLKQPQGKEETVLRSDIEELAASKLSLMPQNLETQLKRQEFADLLAYLKGEK